MSPVLRVVAALLVIAALGLGALAFMLGRAPAPAPVDQGPATPSLPEHQVVVARANIPADRAITADDLTLARVSARPVDAFAQLQDVLGKPSRMAIAAGMPITAAMLGTSLLTHLEGDERGIAIPVDEVHGAGNAIQAGDWVDVFVTLGGMRGGEADTRVRLLLSRVRVLAYGQDSLAPRDAGTPRSASRDAARTAVLAVSLADADRLLLARDAGRLTLALRAPQDASAHDATLFPTPTPWVAPRRDLHAAALAQLAAPANQAFAGLDTGALDGRPMPAALLRRTPPERLAARPPGRGATIEVIRGAERRELPTGTDR